MPEQLLKLLQSAFPLRRLSFLLAFVVALTPFAVDMYLPAMPAMASYFATGIEMMGTSQFALGALTGMLVSLLHTGTLLPLFIIMFLTTAVASLALRISPQQ